MKKLTALLCLLWSISAFSAIDVLNFSSPQQEADYHELTQELRCPQCQNNNIADSNAIIATDMRAKVLELLQEGKSKQDIVQYMIDRYGNFVTYNPPINVATIMLWVMPAVFILIGIIVLFRRKSKLQAINQNETNIAAELSAEQHQRLQTLLNHKDQK